MAENLRRQERREPKLVAAASHFGRFVEFHPTRARPGEELPDNLYTSCTGFLINKQAVVVKLDKSKVLKEAEYFQKFVIIAYFVGGSLSYASLQEWINGLRKDINDDCRIGREIGNGFFQIVTKTETTTQFFLMLSPHLSRWGTSILQPWVTNFNPSKPIGLKLPVWITLKGVRDELLSNAQDLPTGIEVVLGRSRNNVNSADQKFYVAVQARRPFDLEIVTDNPVTNEEVEIQVDSNNLPIRCRLCMSTTHLIKNGERATRQRRTYNQQDEPDKGRDYRNINANRLQ